jgi:hypothetical protein
MVSAASLVKRYKEAAEGGAPGVGTGKVPNELLSALKRVFPGLPEYNYQIGTEAPHLFSYKSDTRFAVNMTDLKMLLRKGLMRMQVNNPGHITLYFGPTGEEKGPPAPLPTAQDFFQMGVDAFKNGKLRTPARDPFLMTALRGQPDGTALPAMKQWMKGWDKANLDAPVPAPQHPTAHGITGPALYAEAAKLPKSARFGSGVFLGPLLARFGTTPQAVSRDLIRLHQDDQITLSRADLVEAMDPAMVKASEIQGPGGVRFHLLRPLGE